MNSSGVPANSQSLSGRRASTIALSIGHVVERNTTSPYPERNVRRSRSVIGRFAGTVSSSALSIVRRTLRFASSGSHSSTGSSSLSLHSSDEDHGGDGRDRLRHRSQAEDRVAPHRRAAVERQRADGVHMLLAAPADERDEARQPAAVHVAAHGVVHPREPRGGDPPIRRLEWGDVPPSSATRRFRAYVTPWSSPFAQWARCDARRVSHRPGPDRRYVGHVLPPRHRDAW